MGVTPERSYLVCATPRSGSTLVCRALSETGVAGRPEEYFEALLHSGRPREPHASVLLREIVGALAPREGGLYVDATLGAGGHTAAILEVPGTRVIGIDRDTSALELARARLAPFEGRVEFLHGRFGEIEALLAEARARPDVEEPDVVEPRRSLRPLLVGLGVIAALAAIVWVAGPRGWDGLDDEQKAQATARYSAEASRIVGRLTSNSAARSRSPGSRLPTG